MRTTVHVHDCDKLLQCGTLYCLNCLPLLKSRFVFVEKLKYCTLEPNKHDRICRDILQIVLWPRVEKQKNVSPQSFVGQLTLVSLHISNTAAAHFQLARKICFVLSGFYHHCNHILRLWHHCPDLQCWPKCARVWKVFSEKWLWLLLKICSK